jgi:hypothetical protein
MITTITIMVTTIMNTTITMIIMITTITVRKGMSMWTDTMLFMVKGMDPERSMNVDMAKSMDMSMDIRSCIWSVASRPHMMGMSPG